MNADTPFSRIVNNCIQNEYQNQASVFLKIASNNLQDIYLLDHIAELQSSIKDYSSTIVTLNKILTHSKDLHTEIAARTNLALVYNKMNEPVLALKELEKLPKDITIEMESALSYYFLGNYEENEKIMNNILQSKDVSSNILDKVKFNLSINHMQNGNFKDGYKQYVEMGHRTNIFPTQRIAMVPLWKGEIEEGKTIIIHAEGGIGDEFIGVRFMNNIRNLGMRPIWKTNSKHICDVFNRNGYESVLNYSDIEVFNSAQVMASYVPIYLNLDENHLWEKPYLKPCENHLEKWKNILPKGKKIAVKWQGNTSYEQDLHRSIPVGKIKDLSYNGTKINLQLEEELKNDWSFSPNINSIEDTLAILWLCDDVLSSCTSVAHMAGSIGKNIIVCPPIAYYYVWAKNISWYASHVTVIRQENWKDWDTVFEKVQNYINAKSI